MILYDSLGRASKFLDLHRHICRGVCETTCGAAFWRWVVREWGGFDSIPHDRFRYAFQRWRPYWSLDFMSPDDRATYSHFPDEGITIFRGQDRNRRLGLSWTINREVAEGFARGHRNFRYRNLTLPPNCPHS